MFNKLVKFIHINIGKKLGCKITDRYAFRGRALTLSLSLSLSVARWYNPQYTLQKPQDIRVFYPFLNYGYKYFVVNAVKKLFDVAFQNKARSPTVFAHRPSRACQSQNSLMRPVTDTA